MLGHGQRKSISEPVLFFWINLILHIPFIGLNRGEFTDGILQLNVWDYRIGLYPPLFGMLAQAIGALPFCTPEIAGRFISALAASALVFPVWILSAIITRSKPAGRMALILLTLSPLLMRWSLHAMTDTLFLLLATSALTFLCATFDRLKSAKTIDSYLIGAVAMTVAAALTRYHGAILVLPVAFGFCFAWHRTKHLPWRALLTAITFVLLPVWMTFNGFAHSAQFSSRTAQDLVTTLLAYLNIAESFIYLSPYYFSLPLMLFAILGVCSFAWKTTEKQVRDSLILWSLWGVLILILQTAFQSFQYRYMLPILPFFVILGGAGMTVLSDRLRSRRLCRALYAIAFAWMIAQMASTVFGQYQSFGDQKQAMQWIKNNIPENIPVYGNERYGQYQSVGCPKWTSWGEREIHPCWTPEMAETIPAGAILALSDAYGGEQILQQLKAAITNKGYTLKQIEMFHVSVIPIFDDVMRNPIFNQNPMLWVMRYAPQVFSTRIYAITPATTENSK